jgi:carbonic anhydrase
MPPTPFGSTPTSAIDDALDANHAYAAGFDKGSLPRPPRRKLAIVTCMDARIDPIRAFGLEVGDAHIIRNAGGRIAEALRSLALSQALLGTQEVMLVHHTDCAVLTVRGDALRAQLKERGIDANQLSLVPFDDEDESIRADLADYDRSPLVRHDIPARGFVFDVQTGRLREVERRPMARTAGA